MDIKETQSEISQYIEQNVIIIKRQEQLLKEIDKLAEKNIKERV